MAHGQRRWRRRRRRRRRRQHVDLHDYQSRRLPWSHRRVPHLHLRCVRRHRRLRRPRQLCRCLVALLGRDRALDRAHRIQLRLELQRCALRRRGRRLLRRLHPAHLLELRAIHALAHAPLLVVVVNAAVAAAATAAAAVRRDRRHGVPLGAHLRLRQLVRERQHHGVHLDDLSPILILDTHAGGGYVSRRQRRRQPPLRGSSHRGRRWSPRTIRGATGARWGRTAEATRGVD